MGTGVSLPPPFLGDTTGALGESYLAERGVSTTTALKYGIEIDPGPTSHRFQHRLGFDLLPEGKLNDLAKEVIWFPCLDSTSKTLSWIARSLPTIASAKFLNAKGKAFPFITRETWAAASKPHKPVIITEGPVKAVVLAQAGQLTIGVGGVSVRCHERSASRSSGFMGFSHLCRNARGLAITSPQKRWRSFSTDSAAID